MTGDEELLALARAHESSPQDLGLALRHARALTRSGAAAGAEAILVAALDLSPGHVELTAELDARGRGRRVGAPWPSPRADGPRSARSGVVGPTRGEVTARLDLGLEGELRTIVVEAEGRALATTRDALCAVDARGEVSVVAALPRGLEIQATVLLPAGRTLLIAGSQALALVPGEGRLGRVSRTFKYSSSFAAGASGLLHCAVKAGRIDALGVAIPAEARTILRTEPDAAVGLAIAPGGDLVVAIEGEARSSRPGCVTRLSSAGELRWRRELPARSLGRIVTQPVIDAAGTTFVDLPGHRLVALDAAGALVFEAPARGEPAGLAGPRGDVLVLRNERSLALVDARTGALRGLLEGAFYGAPKIDARGWVFARRGDDLVAWDPGSPGTLALEILRVGERYWDFAFAGDERIWAFRRTGEGSELVVVE